MRITKNPEVRRQEILDAARVLFMEQGYENTSVDDIAKKLRVAKGLFYYYFPKKEEILAAIAQDFAKEVHAGFSAEDVASQESFPQAIRCILGYFLKVIQQNEALFTMAGTHGMLFSSLLKPQLENQALEHAIAYLKDHPGSLALTYPEYSLQILVRGLGDLYLDGVTDTHVMMTLIEETLSLPKGSLSS